MLGRGVDRRLDGRRRWSPWSGLRAALDGVDLFAFNLESAITDSPPSGSWKMYRFRLHTKNLARGLGAIPLPRGARGFASLANNHVLDYGVDGLNDTIEALDRLGISHAGAGDGASEAWRPTIVTAASGVRVGFVALGDHCGCLRMSQWIAGREQPGMAYSDLSDGQREALLGSVRALEPAVDVVVVSLHSGPNWLPDGPPAWMRELARELVTAGADVVWSHSPHHILPLETIDGRHVIYGPGGLIDDYRRRPEFRNDLGAIVRIQFDEEGGQTARVVPIRRRGRRPAVLAEDDEDYREVMGRLGRGQEAEGRGEGGREG